MLALTTENVPENAKHEITRNQHEITRIRRHNKYSRLRVILWLTGSVLSNVEIVAAILLLVIVA